MRDAKTVVANQVAIAEFRIEDLAVGGGFRVFFRRQLAMGREEWAFGSECVTPAANLMNELAPLPLAGEVRAGVSRVGGKWVVGISCRGHDLVVGPFRSEAIARSFEGELRVRRPGWFAAGSAARDRGWE
jgi:hypothetical protein